MVARAHLVVGVVIEALGDCWAAHSSAAGRTSILNAESASVLEILQSGPRDLDDVAAELASEIGVSADDLKNILAPLWRELINAGLVSIEGDWPI